MVAVRTLVIVVIFVLSATVPASVVATPEATTQSSIAGTQVDADDVVLAAQLQENGDAEWRIEYRVRLDDENATQAFESLQQDIEADPENYTQPFRERMTTTADTAEQTTGREMTIENVTVSAETEQLPREYGVVTYRFTWRGFAVSEDSQLRAGDALSGMFLDSGTTLLMTWPETYQFESADPQPDDRSETAASWSGPRGFTDEQPSLVLTSEAAATGGDGTSLGIYALVFLAIVVLVAILGAVRYRRGGSLPGPLGGDGDESSPTEQGAATGGDRAASGAESSDRDEQVPEELLSNEERVRQLLDEHGGRMKQQQVVQELGWTEAKTSQVVSNLREDDEIETFRIGRENVLTLPGEDEL